MAADSRDSFELLKAALAMAAADGRISGHEKSLLKALAQRAGVGATSLDAMVCAATEFPAKHDDLFLQAVKDPERAMQLLVSTAQIDGKICEAERALLVDISFVLGVSAERFDEIFKAGLAAAKSVRKRREET